MNTIIKIPSPSLKHIIHLIKDTGSDEGVVIDEYLAIVANTLSYVGGTRLMYQHERINEAQRCIEAEINVRSLPQYRHMIETYAEIEFEKHLLNKIRQAHKVYGTDCPVASSDRLKRSPDTWSPKWITVYIWILLCASVSKETMADDSVVMESLFNELVAATNP